MKEFIVFLVVINCFIIYGGANWCMKQKSEQYQQEISEVQKCNDSYQDNCSFFSWDSCTYYELVDCVVKKNITVTRYYTAEECCAGYKLDPINNVTCIAISDAPIKSGVTTGAENRASVTVHAEHGAGSENKLNVTVRGGDDGSDGNSERVSVDDSDDLLFGLSHGAYAGIICTMLFLLCVLILIMLHVRKRSRKAKAKANKSANSLEVETTQKMLTTTA